MVETNEYHTFVTNVLTYKRVKILIPPLPRSMLSLGVYHSPNFVLSTQQHWEHWRKGGGLKTLVIVPRISINKFLFRPKAVAASGEATRKPLVWSAMIYCSHWTLIFFIGTNHTKDLQSWSHVLAREDMTAIIGLDYKLEVSSIKWRYLSLTFAGVKTTPVQWRKNLDSKSSLFCRLR